MYTLIASVEDVSTKNYFPVGIITTEHSHKDYTEKKLSISKVKTVLILDIASVPMQL